MSDFGGLEPNADGTGMLEEQERPPASHSSIYTSLTNVFEQEHGCNSGFFARPTGYWCHTFLARVSGMPSWAKHTGMHQQNVALQVDFA